MGENDPDKYGHPTLLNMYSATGMLRCDIHFHQVIHFLSTDKEMYDFMDHQIQSN